MEENSIQKRLIYLKGERNDLKFAKFCGLPGTTMRSYLEGIRTPTIDNLQKIAAANNVRVGWLAAGELPKELERPTVADDRTMDLLALIEEKKSAGLGYDQAITEAAQEVTTAARKIYLLNGGKPQPAPDLAVIEGKIKNQPPVTANDHLTITTTELLHITKQVLASDTIYRKALESNIIAFGKGIEMELERDQIKVQMDRIEQMLETLMSGTSEKKIENT